MLGSKRKSPNIANGSITKRTCIDPPLYLILSPHYRNIWRVIFFQVGLRDTVAFGWSCRATSCMFQHVLGMSMKEYLTLNDSWMKQRAQSQCHAPRTWSPSQCRKLMLRMTHTCLKRDFHLPFAINDVRTCLGIGYHRFCELMRSWQPWLPGGTTQDTITPPTQSPTESMPQRITRRNVLERILARYRHLTRYHPWGGVHGNMDEEAAAGFIAKYAEKSFEEQVQAVHIEYLPAIHLFTFLKIHSMVEWPGFTGEFWVLSLTASHWGNTELPTAFCGIIFSDITMVERILTSARKTQSGRGTTRPMLEFWKNVEHEISLNPLGNIVVDISKDCTEVGGTQHWWTLA